MLEQRMIRTWDIYDSREAAIADGYPDAEYGWWVPLDGDISRARWGWNALEVAE